MGASSDEIVRLREQVIHNEHIVAQTTEYATARLEEIKDAVRATHPIFKTAPGLLDSVVLAVLDTTNGEGSGLRGGGSGEVPVVRFIHARAVIEQAQAEINRAKAILAQEVEA